MLISIIKTQKMQSFLRTHLTTSESFPFMLIQVTMAIFISLLKNYQFHVEENFNHLNHSLS